MTIKQTSEKDIPLILFFINKLAEYENLTSEVTTNEEILKNSLFGKKKFAESLIAFVEDKPVGFAVYFHNFSTFTGKPGLYLEDLFILPEERGKGYGNEILKYLAKIAIERDCARFEWAVLDWNESAINFYKKLGAVPLDEWTVFRLKKENISQLIQY